MCKLSDMSFLCFVGKQCLSPDTQRSYHHRMYTQCGAFWIRNARHRTLDARINQLTNIDYQSVWGVFWLRCRVCFSLLQSAIMCVRGHRSSIRRPVIVALILPSLRAGSILILINSRWYIPAVQHLTPNAGGGGKGYSIKPGEKKLKKKKSVWGSPN